MALPNASDNLFPKIVIRESANDGSDFSNPAADYRVLFLGEDGLLHLRDSAGTVTDVGAGGGSFDEDWLPWTIDRMPYFGAVAVTNWSTYIIGATSSNSLYAGVVQSSGAQNAEIAWDEVLSAGTWDFALRHYTEANRGIYTLEFDGVSKGTIDGYAGTPGNQFALSSITGITVATTAKIRVSLQMATKNASSSAYYGAIMGYQLRRTA